MQTVVAAFALLGVVMAAMAVGVIFSNKRLKGSCGRECPCTEEARRDCALAGEQGRAS